VKPKLLALDFDGVVCDGIEEFFESSRRAIERVLGQPASTDLRDRFAALRPVVESGWEMVALVGILADQPPSDDAALRDGKAWAARLDAYMRAKGITRQQLTVALDTVREEWIARDLAGWVAHHRFYPGVADWLKRLHADGQLVYILSTKGKQFLDALLDWQDVPLPSEQVIGKAEPKREKWDVLREIASARGIAADDLWFVEDRVTTLLDLRRHVPDFPIRPFFAEWGFVFPDRDIDAARSVGIPVLRLAQMTGPFAGWPAAT
jgi:phosphoglycolate phosphatase-like HAD superfamily hydrolase